MNPRYYLSGVKSFLFTRFELICWITALFLLFIMEPGNSNESICFFRWIGISVCPGCGLGHSINAALHLNFALSIKEHPFGIVGLLIIANRIRELIFLSKLKLQK